MMKKLLFLLLTAWLTFPTYATPLQTLVAKRARQAQAATLQTTDKPVSRQDQILHALQQELNTPLRPISWEQFEQENAALIEKTHLANKKTSDFVDDVYNLDCTLLTQLFQDPPLQTGRPNYLQETQGVKYIYLGEHHGTKTIPAEVLEVLHAVRQAHPKAHILMATEFAEHIHSGNVPLSFSTPQHAEALSVNAYRPPFYVPSKHRKWFETATELNIDVLALEDYLSYPQGQIKMGGALLSAPADNPHVADIVRKYQKDIDNDFTAEDALNDFLARSEWGMNERNQQWARYIKAVSPFYDIIITYAGQGHLSGNSNDVPNLVGEPHYVEFDFYTEEELAKESTNFYKSCAEVQQDQHASADHTIYLPSEQFDLISQLYNASGPTDLQQVHYRKRTPTTWDKADYWELNRLSQQHFQGNWQEGQNVRFKVYLPDINRQEYQRLINNWKRDFAWEQDALNRIRDPQAYQEYKNILAEFEKSFQEIMQAEDMPLQERLKQLKSLYEDNQFIVDDMYQHLSRQK